MTEILTQYIRAHSRDYVDTAEKYVGVKCEVDVSGDRTCHGSRLVRTTL